MDGVVPYEQPWGVEAEAGSAGGAGNDPSAGEMTAIAVVILVEVCPVLSCPHSFVWADWCGCAVGSLGSLV